MKKLVLTVFLIVLITGCGYTINVKLPDRNLIDEIKVNLVDSEDRYSGVFEINQKDLINNIKDKSVIDLIYSHLERGVNTWPQEDSRLTSREKYIISFYGKSESKPYMLLWLGKEEIRIMTRPITPKNITITYKVDKATILLFNELLKDNKQELSKW
ncbi:MAG: hypothetical protein KZQ95_03005 [Candidatus Thiodiazotropha sp. (ex Epidulcina cf. delphinae)]|nr:hypothetical protein [Candidatus Thiodiazotropha sp. (ex Epidulcina cf. delphinae)]